MNMENYSYHKSLSSKDFKKLLTNLGIVAAVSSVTMFQANAIEPVHSEDASIHVKAEVQQSRKISGVITDKSGQPIIGANIVVKGTTNGTITDIDGKYSLEVPNNATLQVSYIGYLSQTIVVGNKRELNVSLAEDTQNLQEIVVVGYGTQKRINLTGAVEQVTSEVFDNRP